MVASEAAISEAPHQTRSALCRQNRSTRWPIGIFSTHGSPAQKARPARNAAERPNCSLTKKVPTTEVRPETPAAK